MDLAQSEKNWSNLIMIPYGRQNITQEDIDAVVGVLKSDFLTQGPLVPAFENAVAQYCAVKFAVAVNSATSALHIACLSLDLGPGDIVWTSPNSFVASANCAIYCGATVDFVDIDSRTYNMSVVALEEKLQKAKKINKLPKIVIPVHFAGQSCQMEKIYALSKEYGFRIIEDASHAIGGRYLERPIGSCQYSDITVFSFHPVKIITTAEGGMAVTNDQQLANRMRLFRSHGITNNPYEMDRRPENEIWNYQQITLGYNYRMTDLQAALGLSQIKRLDEFVSKRHTLAQKYNQNFANLPINLPWQEPENYSSFHLYVICLMARDIKTLQRHVYEAMRASEIIVNLHYIPIYRQPFYERMGFKMGYCPEAESFYRSALSIPMYPLLTEAQQEHVTHTLSTVLKS